MQRKKITTFTPISVGICKHFERMHLQDHLKEEMTLEPGNTALATELALLCTQHCQEMVHELSKSSCPRGSLAPQPGRPGSQPAPVKVLPGVIDSMAQSEPKYLLRIWK